MPTDDQRKRAEANRLYWESDESVAAIADRLDISRRALYDVLRPRPAGVPCPACDTELVYENRMGRSAGEVQCPECGTEADIAALRESTAEAGPAMRRAADRREADRRDADGRAAGRREAAGRAGESGAAGSDRDRAADDAAVGEPELDERAIMLTGAAVVGIAIGAAAAFLLSRRR